jgi:HD-GYP domain-containing protein (c-di-GMP phosphodiesterase class II)
MRLVATRRLEPGARLAKDIPSDWAGVPLLRRGAVISAVYRDALIQKGINAVYIDDDLGEDIDVPEALSEATREEATRVLARAMATAPAELSAGRPLPDKTLDELTRVVELIASDLASVDEAVLAFSDLATADAYTHQHSLDVTVLGLLLGQRLFRERGWVDYRGERHYHRLDERLTKLGTGLLLHDIGKLTIPASILNKRGPLERDEWQLVKRHPLAGVEMLKSDLISPLVLAVVRSHHERWDGEGYPDGKRGMEIHQFARIAAIADVFDAVTSERPYHSAVAQCFGRQVVDEGCGTAFDPEVVTVFRQVVAPFPAGSEVELSDGRRAVVVAVPPDALDRPLVRVFTDEAGHRVPAYELDLAVERDLRIGPPPEALELAA